MATWGPENGRRGSKTAKGVWKGVQTYIFGNSDQFSQNEFFIQALLMYEDKVKPQKSKMSAIGFQTSLQGLERSQTSYMLRSTFANKIFDSNTLSMRKDNLKYEDDLKYDDNLKYGDKLKYMQVVPRELTKTK